LNIIVNSDKFINVNQVDHAPNQILDNFNSGTSQNLAVCKAYDTSEAKVAIGLRVTSPLNPNIGHYIQK